MVDECVMKDIPYDAMCKYRFEKCSKYFDIAVAEIVGEGKSLRESPVPIRQIYNRAEELRKEDEKKLIEKIRLEEINNEKRKQEIADLPF